MSVSSGRRRRPDVESWSIPAGMAASRPKTSSTGQPARHGLLLGFWLPVTAPRSRVESGRIRSAGPAGHPGGSRRRDTRRARSVAAQGVQRRYRPLALPLDPLALRAGRPGTPAVGALLGCQALRGARQALQAPADGQCGRSSDPRAVEAGLLQAIRGAHPPHDRTDVRYPVDRRVSRLDAPDPVRAVGPARPHCGGHAPWLASFVADQERQAASSRSRRTRAALRSTTRPATEGARS
jgi:hypothetical protein